METEVTRYGFHTESRMRETCTYGSMRVRAYPITRGVPLYSTPSGALTVLRPPPPCVGGREKGKVRNAETELTGKNRIIYVQQPKKGRKP